MGVWLGPGLGYGCSNDKFKFRFGLMSVLRLLAVLRMGLFYAEAYGRAGMMLRIEAMVSLGLGSVLGLGILLG